MASVGNLGDITFYCRTTNGKNEILSFHDLQRNSTANFSEHERNGEKSYLEFGGAGLDEITFTVEADARYGIKPLEVQSSLHEMAKTGQAEYFVLGGKKVGDNPFVITGISDSFRVLHIDGRPIAMSFQVTLKEYANQVAEITTIPPARQIGVNKTATKTSNDTYTVVKGDCLWDIAKKFYGSGAQYTKIYNANRDKINNKDLIYPGQVLTIPK